jgi:hypothetical protein
MSDQCCAGIQQLIFNNLTITIPAIIGMNCMESHCPVGLMLRGEKSNSSALNVASLRVTCVNSRSSQPSPYLSFQSPGTHRMGDGSIYLDYASETFLSSTTQCPREQHYSIQWQIQVFNCRNNSCTQD